MQKRKGLNFYMNATKRRAVLQIAGIVFLALLIIRMFALTTFINVPDKTASFITFALAGYMGLMLLLVLPEMDTTLLLLWIALLGFCGVVFLIHRSGLEYICNTVIFLGTLTILPKIQIKEKLSKLLLGLFSLYVILFLAFANREMEDTSTILWMNTNGSAFLCLMLGILFLIFSESFKDKRLRILCYVLSALCLFGQLQFRGRSSLIGSAVYLLYFIFRKKADKISPKWTKGLVAGLCIGAVVFAYFFAVLLFNWVGKGNLVILGKDIFTGRQVIWGGAFEELKAHWLFGIGNTLDTSFVVNEHVPTDNVHNQILGYWTCFGIIVAVLYVTLLTVLTSRLRTKRKRTTAFIITLVLLSYFDTILYSTLTMTYLPLILFLIYHHDCKGECTKMKIHYCWVGGAEKSDKIKMCIDSWKRFCPHAEIIEWNESNYDVRKNPYISQAYDQQKWAFVTDYMRFDILHQYGGVYLDTDVELLKDITPLTEDNFMGFESRKHVAPGLIMHAKQGDELLKEILDYYDALDGFSIDETVVTIVTEILEKHGLRRDNSMQTVAGYVIYPTEYFNPKGGDYGMEKITENTYSIHHYEASWKSTLDRKIMRYKVKYGNKKGRILFTLHHPILAFKKWREKK